MTPVHRVYALQGQISRLRSLQMAKSRRYYMCDGGSV